MPCPPRRWLPLAGLKAITTAHHGVQNCSASDGLILSCLRGSMLPDVGWEHLEGCDCLNLMSVPLRMSLMFRFQLKFPLRSRGGRQYRSARKSRKLKVFQQLP